MNYEGIVTGEFRTLPIGGESVVQEAETRLSINSEHVITVNSPLWEADYTIGDGRTFTDPRADRFLQVVALHQFHHFTTRQLSLVEEFETRPGTSRFVRLGHILDSAKILQDLGATFEQQVQTVISDLAHPAGSHLRGDFMMGDYKNQDTHDQDLWEYIKRSGLLKMLIEENLVESDGRLAGSDVFLESLANPSKPRREDIAECGRPDNNADRAQFTFHEGVIIHDPKEVREAVKSIIRVETKDGERMAMREPEAARLLYKLAVRHQSENWAEPLHRVMEELVILPERYLFCSPNPAAEFEQFQNYYPADYARVDEGSWHYSVSELGMLDPFIPNILGIARVIASHQRDVLGKIRTDDNAYKGPTVHRSVEIIEGSPRKSALVSVGDYEGETCQLWVALPEPKYRGPVDSLVATPSGLRRISEIDPELKRYADDRRRWVQPLLAKITIPASVGGEIRHGVNLVNKHWSNTTANKSYPHPGQRKPMPEEVLTERINQSRIRAFAEAKI